MRRSLIGVMWGIAACSQPAATPDVAAVALTPTEYNNTVRDLLGMPRDGLDWPAPPAVASELSPTDGQLSGVFAAAVEPPPWPWAFPREPGVHGFEGFAVGQEPSSYGIEQLQEASVRYGSYALISPLFFTCEDWKSLPEADQEACGWASIARFAQRAWRRPMTSEEEARLRGFWEATWSGGPPEEAIALVAAGILQAPAFIFRLERGTGTPDARGAVALDDWEVASRLSYFLWDSMPDAQLYAAAAAGELTRGGGLEQQVDRMLGDWRARDAVVHFHRQWMETESVLRIAPSQRAYGPVFGLDENPALDTTGDGSWPAVLGPLRHSMLAEEALFVAETIFDREGTLEALLTAPRGYVSRHTEPLYGPEVAVDTSVSVVHRYGNVSASIGTSDARITLHPATFPETERAGLLTMPSVLAIGAYTVHPAPILRGKRVIERLLCAELGSPPPGAEGAVPPDSVEVDATNRERTEQATSPSACVGCHNQLNPPGFAFENYDALGRWRDQDNGSSVDAGGEFVPLPGEAAVRFDGPIDLARQLAVHPVVRDCYARTWTEYAVGAELGATDPSVLDLQDHFGQSDSIVGLLREIATSDLLRHRQVEATP